MIEEAAVEELEEISAPPWHRMGVALTALAGALISLYLLLYKLGVLGSVACGTGSCETVQNSPWATFLGVPVPAWGFGGYAFIMALALAGLQPRFADSRLLSRLLLGLSAYAFAFSMYLTGIEAFRLHLWCRWCVGSAIVATLMFVFALFEWRRAFGKSERLSLQ